MSIKSIGTALFVLFVLILAMSLSGCGYVTPEEYDDAERLGEAIGCEIKTIETWWTGSMRVIYDCDGSATRYDLYTRAHYEAIKGR